MKIYSFLFIAIIVTACKSSIKQQEDSLYSRHLQHQVRLTIISTKMPDKKQDMNLLLFIGPNLLEEARAKKIIDSLFKKKLIQPMVLVAFEGKEGDYGIEEAEMVEAKQYKKFNEFVIGELYPFVKKKAAIRKFNSVAICGFSNASLAAFDIAFNNDEKIQMAGMFSPRFLLGKTGNSEETLETIASLRKRPVIKIWMEDGGLDSSAIKFKNVIQRKSSIAECNLQEQVLTADTLNKNPTIRNFAAFLLWAFPK